MLEAIVTVIGVCYAVPRLHPSDFDRYALFAMLGGTLAHVLAAPRRA